MADALRMPQTARPAMPPTNPVKNEPTDELVSENIQHVDAVLPVEPKRRRKHSKAFRDKQHVRTVLKMAQRTKHNIPRAIFSRLVRELAQDFKSDLKFSKQSIDMLHGVSEEMLTDRFKVSICFFLLSIGCHWAVFSLTCILPFVDCHWAVFACCHLFAVTGLTAMRTQVCEQLRKHAGRHTVQLPDLVLSCSLGMTYDVSTPRVQPSTSRNISS